jgi:hypothetical protein
VHSPDNHLALALDWKGFSCSCSYAQRGSLRACSVCSCCCGRTVAEEHTIDGLSVPSGRVLKSQARSFGYFSRVLGGRGKSSMSRCQEGKVRMILEQLWCRSYALTQCDRRVGPG